MRRVIGEVVTGTLAFSADLLEAVPREVIG